jgi:hypothetical protein
VYQSFKDACSFRLQGCHRQNPKDEAVKTSEKSENFSGFRFATAQKTAIFKKSVDNLFLPVSI